VVGGNTHHRLSKSSQKGEKRMQRIGFRLQLDASRLDEYVEHHKNVWPEMQAALSETGWHNYTLYLDRSDATLFGYFETPDLQAALDGMAKTDVNSRWQAMMSEFFVSLNGSRPDEGFLLLEDVFHLP
jgi:L-rhamnose mutarotase